MVLNLQLIIIVALATEQECIRIIGKYDFRILIHYTHLKLPQKQNFEMMLHQRVARRLLVWSLLRGCEAPKKVNIVQFMTMESPTLTKLMLRTP